MSDPPEADIVIIRKRGPEWTTEQLRFVPDGLRESRASHIIIKFKFTESLTEDAFFRTGGYGSFYKRHRELRLGEMVELAKIIAGDAASGEHAGGNSGKIRPPEDFWKIRNRGNRGLSA